MRRLSWRIRTITYADCLRFKEARAALPRRRQRPDAPEEPRALATVFRELEVLRAMLLYACRHGWIAKNPFSAGPPLITKTAEESRSRVPTPEEEARLLAVCVPPFRAHLRLIILAARDTGLRRSALQALTWRMVDWEARLIYVPRATSRHKGRPPVVGLTRRLYDALREAWADLAPQDPDARVFPLGDWKKSWTTACRLAGVEGLRFHDLRHGFATDLLEAGVNERLAMKMAGHSNPGIHAVYTNLDARQSLAVAAALDELHRGRMAAKNLDKPDEG